MNYYYQNQPPSRNRRKNSSSKLIIPISITFLIFLSILILTNKPSQTENFNLNISKGDSVQQIANNLKENKAIRSTYFFRRFLSKNNLDQNIQFGSFQIPSNSSYQQIYDIISDTKSANRVVVTIPEGFKVDQIDARLANLGLIQAGEFTRCTQSCKLNHPILQHIPAGKNSLEGFLYPDTYFVDKSTYTNEQLIYLMLDNFQKKLPSNWETQIQALPLKDLYSTIIMASILEREVLRKTERQMVAHILWKRYENDWRLDADASVIYDQDDNIITYEDLQSNSPYNLRKFKGLSPTPIANPSDLSIQAALNPISNPYWFYITTLDTGEVIYAETLEQHNRNVQRYLR